MFNKSDFKWKYIVSKNLISFRKESHHVVWDKQ